MHRPVWTCIRLCILAQSCVDEMHPMVCAWLCICRPLLPEEGDLRGPTIGLLAVTAIYSDVLRNTTHSLYVIREHMRDAWGSLIAWQSVGTHAFASILARNSEDLSVCMSFFVCVCVVACWFPRAHGCAPARNPMSGYVMQMRILRLRTCLPSSARKTPNLPMAMGYGGQGEADQCRHGSH